jgi:hypothetical protein
MNVWTDLTSLFEIKDIWIPTISKKFVPVSHNTFLIKQNKKIERILKLTYFSILEINYRNGFFFFLILYFF